MFRHKRHRDVRVPIVRPATFGHVGEVRDGEIFGWAINPDNPRQPARVTAHVNGRPVAEALAVYYRPDIADLLKCSGRHGFYLDLTQACDVDTEAIVDVRLSNGMYLDGSPLRAHLPRRCRTQNRTLLFMHIPKTAGTALRETILNNYRQSEVAYIYPDPPGFPVRNLRDLPLGQRARFRFVVGHFQYGVHEQIPNDCCYFTIVRNPLSRVYSHYSYLVQHQNPLVFGNGRIKPLQELLESGITANLDNLMVRCFAGVDEKDFPPGSIDGDVYRMGKRHAENAFMYIGQQERLPEAYSFLQSKFEWAWDIPPEMMNRGSYAGEECLNHPEAEIIGRFNRWDLELYEYIRGIFP
jgi:hypothetical protein